MVQKFLKYSRGITNLLCISGDKNGKRGAWFPFSVPGSHKRLLMDVSKSQIRLVHRRIGLEGILSCYTAPPQITMWVKDNFSYHIVIKIFIHGELWPFQAICSRRFWSSELSKAHSHFFMLSLKCYSIGLPMKSQTQPTLRAALWQWNTIQLVSWLPQPRKASEIVACQFEK